MSTTKNQALDTATQSAFGGVAGKLTGIVEMVDYLKNRAMVGDLQTARVHAANLDEMIKALAEASAKLREI